MAGIYFSHGLCFCVPLRLESRKKGTAIWRSVPKKYLVPVRVGQKGVFCMNH